MISARYRLRLLRVLLTSLILTGLVLLGRGLADRPEAAALPAVTFGSLHAPPSASQGRVGSAPPSPDLELVSALRARRIPANRLVIPSLQIDAPVAAQSAPAGDLVIPRDPQVIGRWADSAEVTAGSGTSLLAGHVSVAGVGLGALHRLHEVAPGTVVATSDGRGRTQLWQITGLSVVPKAGFPRTTTAGAKRLLLVTCGGALVQTDRGHSFADNVIATAAPLD